MCICMWYLPVSAGICGDQRSVPDLLEFELEGVVSLKHVLTCCESSTHFNYGTMSPASCDLCFSMFFFF